jgi:hypothetical protein
VDCNNVTQNGDYKKALVSTMLNVRLAKRTRNLLADQVTISLWSGVCCTGLVIEYQDEYEINITKCRYVYYISQTAYLLLHFAREVHKEMGKT